MIQANCDPTEAVQLGEASWNPDPPLQSLDAPSSLLNDCFVMLILSRQLRTVGGDSQGSRGIFLPLPKGLEIGNQTQQIHVKDAVSVYYSELQTDVIKRLSNCKSSELNSP